jgi:hypothetical protein
MMVEQGYTRMRAAEAYALAEKHELEAELFEDEEQTVRVFDVAFRTSP